MASRRSTIVPSPANTISSSHRIPISDAGIDTTTQTIHSTDDTTTTTTNTISPITQIIELLVCTVLIYIVYLTYGFYHEKIPNHNYGSNEIPEKFKFPLFLTTAQCIGNSLWALILIGFDTYRHGKKHPHSIEPFHSKMLSFVFDQVPKTQYLIIATSYALSMLSSTAALTYLSYLIQALAKSSKLIPVMLGKMLRGHRYSTREYFHVILITGGIILFVFDPNKSSTSSTKQATSIIGIILIIFSLAMDAITGPTQDAINDKYKPSVSAMTFWINILPAIAFGLASIVTGELTNAMSFIAQHPSIKFEIGIYCFLAAIGQTLILIALFKFDSMTLTIITTTRKFFSILASVFWFGHTLQNIQWFGVVMVFIGIGADSHLKYVNKHSRKKNHIIKNDDEENDNKKKEGTSNNDEDQQPLLSSDKQKFHSHSQSRRSSQTSLNNTQIAIEDEITSPTRRGGTATRGGNNGSNTNKRETLSAVEINTPKMTENKKNSNKKTTEKTTLNKLSTTTRPSSSESPPPPPRRRSSSRISSKKDSYSTLDETETASNPKKAGRTSSASRKITVDLQVTGKRQV